jgi:ABC-2 type transport system permease protein
MIQLLVLPWAADYEVKNIKLSVVDHDHSAYSRQLVSKITSSGYFILQDYTASYHRAVSEIEKTRQILFSKYLNHLKKTLSKKTRPRFL